MAPLSQELAGRIADAIRQAPGVEGVVLCAKDGQLLATAGSAGPREGALATFTACRADVLPADGDLRGMGRLLAGSSFQQMTAAGPSGETLILAPGPCYVFVAPRRGASAEALASAVRLVLRRYL